MFATPSQMPEQGLPEVETRKALIVLGMQNDIFYVKDDFYIFKNHEILPRLKEMIPYFRKSGDIVWVQTELGTIPSVQTKNPSQLEGESTNAAERNRKERMKEESHLEHDTSRATGEEQQSTSDVPKNEIIGATPWLYPSSKSRDLAALFSADTRAKKRNLDTSLFDDGDHVLAEQLTKPRKGQQARFFIAGTQGAEICDELKDLVDGDDMMITKHFYSAFDQTSLLMSLRMNLCTEVYLCGCFTNISVYATAADAVQHGLQVTVVEDCLGYRNEDKHDEAMRQMADVMGVNGIDSEEIIEESGGREINEAETPGIPLQNLLIDPEVAESQAALASQGTPGLGLSAPKAMEPSTGVGKRGSASHYSVEQARGSPRKSDRQSLKNSTPKVFGPGDRIGSGDSKIIYDALDQKFAQAVFDKVKDEIEWKKMYHRSGEVPRLVAVQGEVGRDQSVPVYRHPSDESPPLLSFTPRVNMIRKEVERLLKQPFNHALIQLYRGGEDSISEHADKTLDIVRNSSIINVSLGAQRVMTLRTKKEGHPNAAEGITPRLTQRVKMPHNSVFVLGPQTNRGWLHSIRADKRPAHEKTKEELSFNGQRISITFRQIGTFMDESSGRIWGSGAKSKTKAKAGRISTVEAEMENMVNAFGIENHQVDFDWKAHYGSGFNVVNLVNSSAKLKLCIDPVANLRTRLALSYKSLTYKTIDFPSSEVARFSFTPWTHGLSNLEKPSLKESVQDQEGVEGDLAILLYLEKRYPSADLEGVEGFTDTQFFRCATESNELLYMWRELQLRPLTSPTHRFRLERPPIQSSSLQYEIQQVLQSWEEYLKEEEYDFVAGEAWTILDCAFWPVLDCVLDHEAGPPAEAFPSLATYHRRGLEKAKAAGMASR